MAQYCFENHKRKARARGIPFLLTFEEWWKIWAESGHWRDGGCERGQYCMARYGDLGAYEVGNVRIILNEENQREAHLGKAVDA